MNRSPLSRINVDDARRHVANWQHPLLLLKKNSSQNAAKAQLGDDRGRKCFRGIQFAKKLCGSNGLSVRGVMRGTGAFYECSLRESFVTFLDVAGLAAALSIRVRGSAAAVIMERSALLRAMTGLDEIEQSWQANLARSARILDGGELYVLLEEMLSADVLLRTWSAFVASSVDAGRRPLQPQSAATLLTKMLLQQRRRLLTTVIEAKLDMESLQQLDRHRRCCERWSDVLLSVFPATSTTRALRFDQERTHDFSELWPTPGICATRTADPVVVTAMKSALSPLELAESPRRQAWTGVAEAIDSALHYDRRNLWTALQAKS